MGFSKLSSIFILLSLSSLFISPAIAAKKSYVVFLGSHSHGPHVTEADLQRVVDSHHQFLGSFLGSTARAKDAIFYSYKNHINGFAAVLDEEHAAEIAKHPEVAAVLPDRAKQLHTTHSWEFMNQEKNGAIYSRSLWKKANFGQDAIIACLDSGVWPESMSFGERGIKGPVPSRWKGGCENNTADGVRCNRKLIGAKYFNKGYLEAVRYQYPSYDLSHVVNSTRDTAGHGTHTLSTAGGVFVPPENVFGPGYGSAKGGSPKARVAAYKVCWPELGCFDTDTMQAFDEAIHDGVDVVNLSVGGDAYPYYDDGIAIGSFHAVKNGIPVACSGGNGGPRRRSVTNNAPWIITVAASTQKVEQSTPAPMMASFSSRGPNVITPEILKPDITAPGVNIIAAFSEASRRKPYVGMSGTSMSSPHIAGIVGLLKSLHPDWSPAAIKSAMMTTARVRDDSMRPIKDEGDNMQGPATPFSFGSGHVQPNGAMDPGLVYDLTTEDYLDFLCAIGYNERQMRAFSDGPYECPASASLLDFNYPSITVLNLDGTVTVSRKLKNVGSPGVYKAKVRVPEGVRVSVEPSVLKFNSIGEEKSFKMTLSGTGVDYADGTLIWTDGKHFVRSPIVVYSSRY